ncbi:MAG: benzoyl-CoA reductase, bzd-type, subunit N [Proteobacteria bacterium]|nr:benzoyl-CoA reductase, bzd-type, subunit N [Pseudomonadota bacterium]MBU4383071.1 benzoyl-CoA reductase, bzd-type, subunit N [Pseudomonadota bacterium]MBU4605165.1 benzoyl-CoA reductase, bzd-type, subunit N [Pseudomonadota bacterium]MCG2762825.1 benzoyl-CoA reductase, bzd-type, subunit N [Desulfarculaceae bacterium]
MIEMFEEWYKSRHEYAKEWKDKTGGKVMGFFCTYVPEEILLAANVLPVRILGSHEPQNVTEPHIFGMYCPFCRDCLAQGLLGRYDYLDGMMIAQSCLHIRQAFTSWKKHMPPEFTYYLPMPHQVQSPRSIPFLRSELETFKTAVEQWVGKEITDADLDRGIELMNASRQAMRDLYDTRKTANPPMTGLEAMYAAVSNQWIDKAEHTAVVRDVIQKELPGRNLGLEGKTRLMILGSEDDDTAFVNMVEGCGSVIVTDDHCTGSRYFWNQVEPEEDRLLAIAKRYITRPACPTKDWPQRTRLDHVRMLAKQWDVAGAIIIQQKFCDPHELDIPEQRKSLDGIGVPTLFLELDVTVPVGQFKIRVEAFLEMLAEDDLF